MVAVAVIAIIIVEEIIQTGILTASLFRILYYQSISVRVKISDHLVIVELIGKFLLFCFIILSYYYVCVIGQVKHHKS